MLCLQKQTTGDATTPIQMTSNRSRQGVPFLSEDSHGIFIDMLWWARSHQHVSEKCETLLNIVKHPPNRKISTETPDVDTELCRGVVVTATLAIFEILNCKRSGCIICPHPFGKWKDTLLSANMLPSKKTWKLFKEMIIERHDQIAKVRCGEDHPQNLWTMWVLWSWSSDLFLLLMAEILHHRDLSKPCK